MNNLRYILSLLVLCTYILHSATEEIPLITIPTSTPEPVMLPADITRQVCHSTLTPAFYERQINPNDFDKNAGSDMYTITDGGRYYLPQDIPANPKNNNITAIKINASNVALNMNARTLSHTGSATGLTMIEIASNVSNVIIFNGTINGVNGTGIKINSGCSGITLCSMTINACNLLGIIVTASNNISLREVTITNCSGASSSATDGALGLKITDSSSIAANGCHFNNNSSSNKNGTGALITHCTDCIFEQCSASNNIGNNGYGFKLTSSCVSCQFVDCSAVANEGDNGQAVGFYVDWSNAIKCIACQAEAQLSFVGEAIGYLINNSPCFVITKCDAQYNKASTNGQSVYGYKITSSNSGSIACSKATANIASTGSSYGFYYANSQYNLIEECVAQGNNASSSTGSAYGFFTTAGTANSFEKCSAIGNQGGTIASSVGAGFSFRNSEKYSSILSCYASANSSGSNGTGYGIQLGSSGETITRCVVKNNQLIDNTGKTQYGYKDFTNTTTTFLASNIAYGQGRVLSSLGLETAIIDDGANNYQCIFDSSADIKKILIEMPISDFSNINNGTSAHNISVY